MSAFVMAAVQTVIVVFMLMLINHFPFDDGVLGTLGRNSCTRGAANGPPDDGPVPSADGRTHGSPGAAAERAADYSVAIDAAGESGRREGGQGEEDEGLFACHVDPFMGCEIPWVLQDKCRVDKYLNCHAKPTVWKEVGVSHFGRP